MNMLRILIDDFIIFTKSGMMMMLPSLITCSSLLLRVDNLVTAAVLFLCIALNHIYHQQDDVRDDPASVCVII